MVITRYWLGNKGKKKPVHAQNLFPNQQLLGTVNMDMKEQLSMCVRDLDNEPCSIAFAIKLLLD